MFEPAIKESLWVRILLLPPRTPDLIPVTLLAEPPTTTLNEPDAVLLLPPPIVV